MKKQLDWSLIWAELDAWFRRREQGKTCSRCKHTEHDYPEWGEQQAEIERLVNQELRAK